MDAFLSAEHTMTGRRGAEICSKLKNIDAVIYFEKDGRNINGKSLIGLLSLGIVRGDPVRIIVQGDNEEYVLSEVIKIIKENI